jgi:hypothetical protein
MTRMNADMSKSIDRMICAISSIRVISVPLSVLRKLAGQTAIYRLSSVLLLSLAIGCARGPKHDLAGRWQTWMNHSMGKEELLFLADGTFIDRGLDAKGVPREEFARGTFRLDGDTLRITRPDFVGAYCMKWKSERELLLVRDDEELVLERPQQ